MSETDNEWCDKCQLPKQPIGRSRALEEGPACDCWFRKLAEKVPAPSPDHAQAREDAERFVAVNGMVPPPNIDTVANLARAYLALAASPAEREPDNPMDWWVSGGDTVPLFMRTPPAPAVTESCEWYVSNTDWGTWSSGCGKEFEFNDDGPKENGFKFCHACGKPVTIAALRGTEG